MVEKLKELRPKLHFFWVTWKYPNSQRMKCNTDGRSRGNLGLSSYEAQGIGITTNTDVESRAIYSSLKYCQEKGLKGVTIEIDSLDDAKIKCRHCPYIQRRITKQHEEDTKHGQSSNTKHDDQNKKDNHIMRLITMILMKAITKYRRSGDRATKDESSDERLVRPSFYCKNILQEKRKGRRSSLVLDKVIKIHQEIGCETLTIEDEVDASSNGKKQARRGRRVDSFKESAENTFICKV
ncbi:hypothetical protein KY289_008290 [Solanum tuberosum]|nr:hypothetical protein KY289_008290 [Solanum tuberosum]